MSADPPRLSLRALLGLFTRHPTRTNVTTLAVGFAVVGLSLVVPVTRSVGFRQADDGDETDAGTDHADTERPVEYLKWAGVVVLAVTAMVALFGFYTGVSRAITVWISSGYRPLVSAAFNLSLLLVAVGGIGLLLRRGD